MSKVKRNAEYVQSNAKNSNFNSYTWVDPKWNRGRSGVTALPRCSWRNNNTLVINLPFDLLKQAGIKTGSLVDFKVSNNGDLKAIRIEPGNRLKVRTATNRPDYPCAFINVTIPDGALTGSHVMAALEDVSVDGEAIAFRLPGDLAFAPAEAE